MIWRPVNGIDGHPHHVAWDPVASTYVVARGGNPPHLIPLDPAPRTPQELAEQLTGIAALNSELLQELGHDRGRADERPQPALLAGGGSRRGLDALDWLATGSDLQRGEAAMALAGLVRNGWIGPDADRAIRALPTSELNAVLDRLAIELPPSATPFSPSLVAAWIADHTPELAAVAPDTTPPRGPQTAGEALLLLRQAVDVGTRALPSGGSVTTAIEVLENLGAVDDEWGAAAGVTVTVHDDHGHEVAEGVHVLALAAGPTDDACVFALDLDIHGEAGHLLAQHAARTLAAHDVSVLATVTPWGTPWSALLDGWDHRQRPAPSQTVANAVTLGSTHWMANGGQPHHIDTLLAELHQRAGCDRAAVDRTRSGITPTVSSADAHRRLWTPLVATIRPHELADLGPPTPSGPLGGVLLSLSRVPLPCRRDISPDQTRLLQVLLAHEHTRRLGPDLGR